MLPLLLVLLCLCLHVPIIVWIVSGFPLYCLLWVLWVIQLVYHLVLVLFFFLVFLLPCIFLLGLGSLCCVILRLALLLGYLSFLVLCFRCFRLSILCRWVAKVVTGHSRLAYSTDNLSAACDFNLLSKAISPLSCTMHCCTAPQQPHVCRLMLQHANIDAIVFAKWF